MNFFIGIELNKEIENAIESSLNKIWDNKEDDIYEQLLEK